MIRTIIAILALLSLSICALAESKEMGLAENDHHVDLSPVDLSQVEFCGAYHLSSDCRLSRELAKGFTNKRA